MNEATKNRLRHKAHQIKPLLSLDDGFTIKDVRDKSHNCMKPANWLYFLHHVGAIKKREKVFDNDCRAYIHIWEWDREKKRFLESIDYGNQLPCGCRGHIPDMRDSPEGKGHCKHCGAEHDKEIFKQAL